MSKAYQGLGNPSTELKGAGAVYAVVEINSAEVELFMGLTKGGGTFTDGREVRMREADGDFFDVKGAIDIVKFKPAISIPQLALSKANMLKMASGLEEQAIVEGSIDLSQGLDLTYITKLRWYGKSRAGYDTMVELENAISIEPFAFDFAKDEEVIANITYQATADPATFDIDDLTTYPYKLVSDGSTVTFTLSDGSPAADVLIVFENDAKLTDVSGEAIFVVGKGASMKYTATKTGFIPKSGTVDVEADTVAVAMTIVSV